ncbi:MAG: Hsp20/alpha crystallin family protein [Deltaproteobacteria bacterium]|jgi:HSP20 family protein|nr:Hsp20/alpha crystallin family protein [Deltaproteobacteria bacterium]
MSKRFGETFEDLYSMKEQMDKLLKTSLGRSAVVGEGRQRQWSPPADLYENETEYVLEVELPGVKMETLEVSALPDQLRIRGRKEVPARVEQEKVFRLERPAGFFDRSFNFPCKIDPERVRAAMTDGVLQIRLPKVGSQPGKQIPVQGG